MFGFETVVYLVLRTVLGKFIDLDQSNLNLSLWRGDFEFNNLYICQNLLHNFGLPVTLFSGKIASLRLIIPWRKLWEKSVEIHIDGITVLGSSREIEKSATQEPEKVKENQKQTSQSTPNSDSSSSNSPPADASYMTKLLTTILHNVKVDIRNVMIWCEQEHSEATKTKFITNSFSSIVAYLFAATTATA